MRDPREVYISTCGFETPDLDFVLSECAAHDIRAIELSSIRNYAFEPLNAAQTAGGYPSRFLVHNYFPPPGVPFTMNPASCNHGTAERTRRHCESAIDLAARLGSPLYALHAGFTADIDPHILGRPDRQAHLPSEAFHPYEKAYGVLYQSMVVLNRYAKERGVRLLIENHVLSPLAGEAGRSLLLMTTAEELLRLVRDVGDSNFGILVDVGHLNVTARTIGFDPHRFIDAAAPYIGAFHLSDNNGEEDQNRPFGEDAWFVPRLREFPDAWFTLEVAPCRTSELASLRNRISDCIWASR